MSPRSIRLDEDVFCLCLHKTSSRRLQGMFLIKTNIFALVIGLQKTVSRRLQDVLVKTNIFVLVIPLQDIFSHFLIAIPCCVKMLLIREERVFQY